MSNYPADPRAERECPGDHKELIPSSCKETICWCHDPTIKEHPAFCSGCGCQWECPDRNGNQVSLT